MRQVLMIIAGCTLLLLALGVLASAYVFLRPQTSIEEPTESGSQNPFGELGSASVSSEERTSIQLTDGSVATIPDFSKSTNQPPVASDVNGYQVAGAADAGFQILYFPLDSGFIITLNTEPIGETRKLAEGALRAQLGLSDAQICKIPIDVGVPYNVNSTYSGSNLGLSFCPGSVTLP